MDLIMIKLDLIANVIWNEKAKKPNSHVVLRKSFEVNNLPVKANAYIAVDTKYWLYVNGELVVFEGGLFRESMPGCGYADKMDIAPYLRNGNNTIAIHVFYYGNQGRNNVDSGAGGLLFECDALDIISDETFKCIAHPAYYETDDPQPAYLFGGHNLGFDST